MDNLKKTLWLTGGLSAGGAACAYMIQSQANKTVQCASYLDPITIDIVAFLIGFFLSGEALAEIFRQKDLPPRRQFLRCIRVAIGVSIITIHVMQFLHK
ncbi:MAG: hypothetical protein NC924_00415 [Candidatus Omnitrophica bacterium]|nr:hypothetical protein [Candidatus Omnitrophota bacterium]